ncbi:MAG: Trm112 family protein [Chloroflexi bacterium]|nr:Trm112 family protein [Chloroflexota bacterium]
MPISQELFEILRCPKAVQEKEKYGDPRPFAPCQKQLARLRRFGFKYPIRDGIPVMLIEEGEKWQNTAEADLPVPPPA